VIPKYDLGTRKEMPISETKSFRDLAFWGNGELLAIGIDQSIWGWEYTQDNLRRSIGAGTNLAASDGLAVVVDPAGRRIHIFSRNDDSKREQNPVENLPATPTAAAVDAGSCVVVALSKRTFGIFDKSGKQKGPWAYVPSAITALATSEEVVLLASDDGTVQYFDGEKRIPVEDMDGAIERLATRDDYVAFVADSALSVGQLVVTRVFPLQGISAIAASISAITALFAIAFRFMRRPPSFGPPSLAPARSSRRGGAPTD